VEPGSSDPVGGDRQIVGGTCGGVVAVEHRVVKNTPIHDFAQRKSFVGRDPFSDTIVADAR
jgi:hypothetical protein